MNIEQKLTEYLKEKYNPVAIVLHGSRAIGMEKEHSDWDFLIFKKEGVNGTAREIKYGANVEMKSVLYPLEKKDEMIGFFFRSENIRIIYDPQNIVPEIVKCNDSILAKGNDFKESYRVGGFAFLCSALDGMKDYQHNELLAMHKKMEFYSKSINCWFKILHREYKPSDYIAFPIIEKRDPKFFSLVNTFVNAKSTKDCLQPGREMIQHLFPDLYNQYQQ
jgi:predicted nucleotidyltransferase